MEQFLPTHYFLVRKTRRVGWDWQINVDSSWLDLERALSRLNDIVRHYEGLGETFGVEQFVTYRGVTNHWMRNSDSGLILEVARFEFERIYDWETVVPGITDVAMDPYGLDDIE
jgi:hypothetical protein